MNALLSLADLHVIQDEPRVHDLRLAEALGFGRTRDVRKLIERNVAELERYGVICATVAQINRRPDGRIETRGRPTRAYHLNEGQALLVCMFSATERAADVRQQLIEVFMAWRRGQLPPSPPAPAPIDPLASAFAQMTERLAAIEAMLDFGERCPPERLAASITHLPIWPNGRRPRWWLDNEVRALLTVRHRQATIDQVRIEAVERFGEERAPSKSSLCRYWCQLDRARGNGRPA